MNKKIIALTLALVVLGTGSVFALGIGLQGGFDPSSVGTGSLAVTFKLDSAPWVFAVNGSFGDHLGLGLTADMWRANKNLVGPLNYYYGWGLAGSLYFSENAVAMGAGFRILGGLNAFILDNFLEFYLQAAWQPNIGAVLSDSSGLSYSLFSFPADIGFRFWL